MAADNRQIQFALKYSFCGLEGYDRGDAESEAEESTPGTLGPSRPLPRLERGSIAEDPKIVVYDRSRKAAEVKAAKKFLATADRCAYTRHPLSVTKAVRIEMEYDGDAEAFVTFVKELHRMSTFGSSEDEALDSTAEMIRGYIKSMETNRKKIRLSAARLAELKGAVGLR